MASSSNSYIAAGGQWDRQAPHSMQSSGFMYSCKPSRLPCFRNSGSSRPELNISSGPWMQSTGQAVRQPASHTPSHLLPIIKLT